ncbi:hypothetical protein [Brevundimonas sp.]|uniref:hypothetical protein n=1 Tax=Brevundimonas sp. TaxID=1871086 RepID=UPI003D6CAC77
MKPIEFSNADALIVWLRDSSLPEGFILLDGFPDAGKSHLGSKLSQSLGRGWVQLDQVAGGLQMSPSRPRYTDLLTAEAFNAAVEPNHAVLDGVTMLDIADKFALPIKAHIYVKRLTTHGLWPEEDELQLINPRDLITSPSALRLCVREYHQRTLPHQMCDALLTWYPTE